MKELKVDTIGRLIAALGSKNFNPLGYVSKAIDGQSIKGLSRKQVGVVSKTVMGAFLRSDAWAQDPALSREIIDNGMKFVAAENLLTKADAIDINTERVLSKLK